MSKSPDAAAMVKDWKAGMQTGATKWADRIQRYNGNPMALAAAAVQDGRYLTAITEAVSSGRMVAKLNAIDPSFWKSQCQRAGVAAFAAGASKGAPKYERAAAKIAQAAAAGSQAASAVTGAMAKVQANMAAICATWGVPCPA